MERAEFIAFRKRRRRLRSLLAITALSLLITACGGSGSQADDPLVARTGLGEVHGFEQEGVVWFLGIPYARPPVGELRFRPPEPAEPWSAPITADRFGPACPQPVDPSQALYREQSEDCLRLNVWTPAADGRRRPVMYWIHGGGWIYEGTEDPLYRGSVLARSGDVVVVSVEYRLGAFGFTDLSAVAGAGPLHADSANAGILDQILGLRWVHEHISAFGGDPGNVTILGESAGGSSVAALMAMKSAAGLFHRAVAQSPALATVRTTPFATRVTESLMGYAGVTDLAGLLALDERELVAAEAALIRANIFGDYLFGLSVAGSAVPHHPVAALRSGMASDVPLMIGTNRDELRLYATDLPLLTNVSLQTIAAFLPVAGRAIPDHESKDSTAAFYESVRPGGSGFEVAMAFGTDVFFRIPALRFAEAAVARNSSPVFVYRFDFEPAAPAWPDLDLGAPHGAELGFMFGTPDGWSELYGPEPPVELIDQMLGAWLSFARDGVPRHATLPEWQPYRLDTRPTMIFDAAPGDDSHLHDDPSGAERRFWEVVPFDGTLPSLLADDLRSPNRQALVHPN